MRQPRPLTVAERYRQNRQRFKALRPVVTQPVAQAEPAVTGGPGTELKKLFVTLGIRPSANCKCNARAREMDQRGCEWCEQNIELIVDWLEEAAKQLGGWQGILFTRFAARAAVRIAIKRAKERAS